MRTRNEMMPPADAGPVERPVRHGDRSEMSESRKSLLAAFGAASAAREQDLRGQYPKAAIVLAEEVFSLRETASRAADYLRRAIKAEAEVALLRAAGLGA